MISFFHDYDASASWFGYHYQGRLALKYIIKKISEIKMEEIEKYELEIESMEDFSIKYDGNYISIHQVKSGQEKHSDINNLFFGKLEKKEVEIYFHYISSISNFEELKSKFLVKKSEISKEIENYMKIEEDKLEESFKSEGKKNSLERAVYNSRTKENFKIKEALKKSKELLENYDLELLNEENFNFILEEKDIEKVDEEIKQYIIEINKKIDKVIIMEDISNKILSIGDIIYIHINNRVNEKKSETIKLSEILDVLKRDTLKKSEFYEAFEILQNFEKKLIEYVGEECQSECQSCKEKTSCNLYKNIKVIYKKVTNIKDMYRLVQNIQPNNSIVSSDFSTEYLIDTLYPIIREIKKLKLVKNKKIVAVNENKNYWAIDTNFQDEDKFKRRFVKKLNENRSNILELIYEADVLISKHMNISDIFGERYKFSRLSEKELKALNKNTRNGKEISKIKQIDVIDLNKALEAIEYD